MVARGAAVTGLNAVGAFNALQTIPGTAQCSFGDVAISPAGVVVQACQNPVGGQGPSTIRVNIDADGLGPGNFGATIAATTTNVGGFDFLPVQNARSIDAEAGLAYDNNPASPHVGRLYLVYTEETVHENHDMDIMLRFSDNNGANWSAPIRLNDDPAAPIRSQFLPKISVDDTTGNVGVCWHDARNSAGNNSMQVFCTVAGPAGATPTFLAQFPGERRHVDQQRRGRRVRRLRRHRLSERRRASDLGGHLQQHGKQSQRHRELRGIRRSRHRRTVRAADPGADEHRVSDDVRRHGAAEREHLQYRHGRPDRHRHHVVQPADSRSRRRRPVSR